MDESELVSRLSCAMDDELVVAAVGLVEHLLMFVLDEYGFRLIGSRESLMSSG